MTRDRRLIRACAALFAALVLPAPGLAAEDSSVVYFTPGGESPKPVAFGEAMVRELADARKQSPFPKPGTSILPERLYPLVADLAVILGGRECKDHRLVEVRPARPEPAPGAGSRPEDAMEIWVVAACGRNASYLIALMPCKGATGTSIVAVTRAHQRAPRPIFYGAHPLDAGLAFPLCEL